ncbi:MULTISPECIES: DUF3558 domain-containing protein [Actinosynnema]|uniref:DUF3558 domain-containing protein n=1 Tax=Actinosynnema TaxID=40566 RepID=UPI0020A4F2C6|nr:DUF3558 domain-containing protein [Actinosynnema pretiosum]MCP2097407.1 Protein of unknown function (DUF3558) [Actinosynnema pretiosum]
MLSRRALITSLACAAALTAAACDPAPTPPTPPPSMSTSAAASSSGTPGPSRPRELSLDGADPCELLTPRQRAELHVTGTGRPLEIKAFTATGCTWNDIGVSHLVMPVLIEGIETWTGGTRPGRPARIEDVEGFPAFTVTLPDDPDRCDVVVDTADGQYLSTGFSVVSDTPQRHPQPCPRAIELARAVLRTLLAQTGPA